MVLTYYRRMYLRIEIESYGPPVRYHAFSWREPMWDDVTDEFTQEELAEVVERATEKERF